MIYLHRQQETLLMLLFITTKILLSFFLEDSFFSIYTDIHIYYNNIAFLFFVVVFV